MNIIDLYAFRRNLTKAFKSGKVLSPYMRAKPSVSFLPFFLTFPVFCCISWSTVQCSLTDSHRSLLYCSLPTSLACASAARCTTSSMFGIFTLCHTYCGAVGWRNWLTYSGENKHAYPHINLKRSCVLLFFFITFHMFVSVTVVDTLLPSIFSPVLVVHCFSVYFPLWYAFSV